MGPSAALSCWFVKVGELPAPLSQLPHGQGVVGWVSAAGEASGAVGSGCAGVRADVRCHQTIQAGNRLKP